METKMNLTLMNDYEKMLNLIIHSMGEYEECDKQVINTYEQVSDYCFNHQLILEEIPMDFDIYS